MLVRSFTKVRRSALTAFALLVGTVSAAAAQSPPTLPPEDCVRMLREARFETDPAGELAHLRAAREAFPDEIAVLAALLGYHQRHALPAAEHAALVKALGHRVENRDLPLPVAMLAQVAQDRQVAKGTAELLAERLASRIARTDAAPEPEALGLLARYQARLDDLEGTFESLSQQWELTGDPKVRWQLATAAERLERWSVVLDLLAEIPDRTVALERRYLKALGKAGSADRFLAAIDALSDPAPASEPPADQAAEQPINLDELFGIERSVPAILQQAAWDLWDRGLEAESERVFRRLLSLRPKSEVANAAILHLFASDQEIVARTEAAEDRWAKVTDAQSLFDEGTRRMTTGDAAGAVDLLRRAAPGLPDLEAAWYNLGMASFRLEQWDEAAGAFGRAAQLNPRRAEAHYFLGLALHRLARCGEAVTSLENAIGLAPSRTTAHYYLAECYATLGDAAAAKAHRDAYEASKEP
ncbi:MAG: tetratricopeptide repeat protein [Acidobacteriota bacterium]